MAGTSLDTAMVLRALDANGDPVSGALLTVYVAGTTTTVTTFADENLTTPNASPVVADSSGAFGPIYVPNGSYKVSITDPNTVVLPGYPVDDIEIGGTGGSLFDSAAEVQTTKISAGRKFIRTAGYSAPGDGGGGQYVRDAGEGPLPGDIVSADGQRWHLVPAATGVMPEQFGAEGDAITDDLNALAAGLKFPLFRIPGKTFLTTSGLISAEGALRLQGSGIFKNAAREVVDCSIIKASSTAVADLLTMQSQNPSGSGATNTTFTSLRDFGLFHRGGGAAVKIDNIVHARLENLVIECNNEGVNGIETDNNAYFATIKGSQILRFTGIGILIDGEGTQHTIENTQTSSFFGVTGIETRRPGTIIRGSQHGVNIGWAIRFWNPSSEIFTRGLVDGVLFEDDGIEIDGASHAFADVVIENCAATLGSGQTMVKFGRALGCALINPMVNSPTGGTIANWGAASRGCGVIGNFNACRAGIVVDPSATTAYKICNQRLQYFQRASITTDPNLTTTCEDVEHVGRCVHNGKGWDKHRERVYNNTATSFPLIKAYGSVRIGSNINRQEGVFADYENVGAAQSKLSEILIGADVDIATGPLTGTTGSVGKVTVSIDGANELLYIENRLGVEEVFNIEFEDASGFVNQDSPLTYDTADASASGTVVDFSGAPANASRATLLLRGVSTTGTDDLILQLGTSSGFKTSGYTTNATLVSASGASTDRSITSGIPLSQSAGAGDVWIGEVVCTRQAGGEWVCRGSLDPGTGATGTISTLGTVTLSGDLTQLRVTTVAGTDSFDSPNGKINVVWE